MKSDNSKAFQSRQSRFVTGILLLSLILRWILILRGGQYFHLDEPRYEVSRDVARFLQQGQLEEALQQFTLSPEHLGFKVFGVLPALLEPIVGTTLVLPAFFYSLFSVLNLYLVFLLAQRSQVSSNQSLYALFFAASCLSLLYYSRHLLPYDMAMFFGLLALYRARAQDPTAWTSVGCGVLSFLCFITYNGYWPLAGFAMLVNISMSSNNIGRMAQKAIFTMLGFILPVVLLITVMWWLRTDIISAYHRFATTINQGSFQEGWRLPFEYFWHTEHVVILILGAFSTLAISRFRSSTADAKLWMTGTLFIYLCLLIPSVVLEYFVVYARLARQMIPFLCLLAAEGLEQMESHAASGRKIIRLVFLIVILQAAWNFSQAYRLSYPREFVAEAQARYPGFKFSPKRLWVGAPVVCQHKGYVIQNAKFYLTPPEEIPEVKGQLLLSAPHPATYLPYRYEGDTPALRQVYRTLSLRMNFYKADEQFMSETNPAWTTIKSCVATEEEDK